MAPSGPSTDCGLERVGRLETQLRAWMDQVGELNLGLKQVSPLLDLVNEAYVGSSTKEPPGLDDWVPPFELVVSANLNPDRM